MRVKCADLCTCVLVSFMFSFCNLCSVVAQMQKLRSPMLGIQSCQSSLLSVWSRSECNFVCYNCCQIFFLLERFIIPCGKFGSPYLNKATAAARAVLSITISVCVEFCHVQTMIMAGSIWGFLTCT